MNSGRRLLRCTHILLSFGAHIRSMREDRAIAPYQLVPTIDSRRSRRASCRPWSFLQFAALGRYACGPLPSQILQKLPRLIIGLTILREQFPVLQGLPKNRLKALS
jgi:hypothetical protein